MAYVGSRPVSSKASPAVLTAPLAIALAETEMKAGNIENAARYVNVAYAIFDAQIARSVVDPGIAAEPLVTCAV